ncbi:general stress protein [Bacillus horti]|nr:general stress protein [Bacillus horti]
MKPVVREYMNDEKLVHDVQELANRGIDKNDMFILSHDDDRTNRVADSAEANTIGVRELGLGSAVSNIFVSKGDELRKKIEEIGLSSVEAELYEEKLDEGKILLFIMDHEKVQDWV